jgi:opacity protein-like surface antigen
MRLAHAIVLASLLAAPAMAADVLVTPPAPGVVVTPGGNPGRDVNQATKHEERANKAAAKGNYGNAAKQENKANRALNKADRDSTGAVVIER